MDQHVTKPAWSEHTLSLAKFAGREVEIEFRTDCGPANKGVAADHGLWGDPRIEAGGKRVYEFVKHMAEATTGWRVAREWHMLGTRLPLIKGQVVTSPYFTYWLLNRLRGERLTVQLDGRDGIHSTDTVGALACRDDRTVRVLLWHFDGSRASLNQHLDADELDVPRTLNLRIAGLPAKCRVRRYLIDHDHTNAYTDYVLKGKSNNGGRYNLENGKVDVVLDETRDSRDGQMDLSVRLRNLSVSLVEIEPEGE